MGPAVAWKVCGTLLTLGLASPLAQARDDDFAALQRMILPGKGDSRWLGVAWQPASNIWAARQKAAREGKPIFLWYMAGEPLGPC
ncbi:MAG: hypothetical protein FJ271_09775 [Planctomycetes bacterium]|nr:hypothetical protein [Planctomycetota bacterium]